MNNFNKKLAIITIFCISLLSQVSIAGNLTNTSSKCSSKKYQLCCTGKKALFKSLRCINYQCFAKPGNFVKKPAIYLYPKKQTKVHITLDKCIYITYDAPRYAPNIGWNVLAFPDGKIKDLKPKYTDCKRFDNKKFGLEYAKKACEANNYPYVYWEGRVTKMPYTDSKTGWIVKTKDLQGFLNKELDYIGFNKPEKEEFIKYWTHKLSQTKNQTYFIYFQQNKTVDEIAPMQVTPRPDSINRIYMVAKPISKPKTVPLQHLEKFKRKGFTLVEWGGLVL